MAVSMPEHTTYLVERCYRYEPLPGRKFIRLLILHPAANRHEPVVCDLIIRPLQQTTIYSALSYSWGTNSTGDAALIRLIRIGTKYFPVTQNLFEALQRLRSSRRPQPIWVDAICINQNDVAERNSQVSRMAQIYAYARQVVAWLGEGQCRADDTAALAILRCLQKAPHPHYDPTHVWHTRDNEPVESCNLVQTIWILGASDVGTEEWLRQQGFIRGASQRREIRLQLLKNEHFEKQLNELERILTAFVKRRYFTRRWIVQELYFPAQDSIIFAWGPCTYSIKSLTDSLDLAHRFLTALRYVFPMLGFGSLRSPQYQRLTECESRVCDIYNVLEMKVPDEDGLPLYNVLHRCTSLECSDKRDIVFAVCSLDPYFGLKADYNQSVEGTYTQFARLLVQKDLLELLLHNLRNRNRSANHWKDSSQSHLMPTWVPDLSLGFVDAEIPYATVSGQVDSDNRLTCSLYQIAHLHTCERSIYGQIVLSDAPGSRDQPIHGETETRAWNWWDHRKNLKKIRHRTLGKTPLLGATYKQEDPLSDAKEGDLICSTRADCLVSGSLGRDLAEVVILRPAREKNTFTIFQVFSSKDLKYFGPNEDVAMCLPIQVRIV